MEFVLDETVMSEEFLNLVKQYQDSVEKQKKLIELVKKMETDLRNHWLFMSIGMLIFPI